jgi:hypothetical protein
MLLSTRNKLPAFEWEIYPRDLRKEFHVLALLYYGASVFLAVLLVVLGLASLHPRFADWLGDRPKVMILLLGINLLPLKPVRTLRRFYLFLSGGWIWLLVWSWWLMPWLKNLFYHNVPSLKAYQMARISTLILLVAYSAFGFYCIGKALNIWYKEIYNRLN